MRPLAPSLRIASVLLVLGVVMAVFVIGPPGDDEPRGSAPATATSRSPTSTPAAPPSSVSTDDFCSAFRAMAAAQANHLANDTDISLVELSAAAETVLRLEPGTAMPPAARQGLRELVEGVLGTSTTAPDEEAADALTAFLEVACPGGAF